MTLILSNLIVPIPMFVMMRLSSFYKLLSNIYNLSSTYFQQNNGTNTNPRSILEKIILFKFELSRSYYIILALTWKKNFYWFILIGITASIGKTSRHVNVNGLVQATLPLRHHVLLKLLPQIPRVRYAAYQHFPRDRSRYAYLLDKPQRQQNANVRMNALF